MNALIVEEDELVQRSLARLVREGGFAARTASGLAAAREEIRRRPPDLALLDLALLEGEGIGLVDELKRDGDVDVIVIAARPAIESAVASFPRGTVDHLTKPIDVERLRGILARCRRAPRTVHEPPAPRRGLTRLAQGTGIVGSSPGMQAVHDLLLRVAPTEATVLLVGETGVGKEVVARGLHRYSRRSGGPFEALNCGALQPTLVESELFGHERGSFTGADRRHTGLLERARGGTLMLDEITEMPRELQVKLLRVLETRTFRRVGGNRDVPMDARVVAATNRSPEKAVRERRLREDLYYRLDVFRIRIPPLRERADDVAPLAVHFVNELNEASGTDKRLTPEALTAMRRRTWPGNVRELRNCIERAFILAPDETGEIDAGDVMPVNGTPPARRHRSDGAAALLGMTLAEAQRELILATLDRAEGDKKQAAETLGISLKTLYNRLHMYGRMP